MLLRPDHGSQRFTIGSEDGTIFAAQPRASGIWRSFHTTYAGYLHLLPRCVGAIASALPLQWTPVVFVLSAGLIAGTAAVITARSARGMDLSPLSAALVGSAVLVLAAAGWEVPLLLTNVQWYVLVAFVVFMAAWTSGYCPPIRWAVPLIVVGGLTSPLFVVSLPVVVATLWRRKERIDFAITGAIAFGTLVQIGARITSSQSSPPGQWTVAEIAKYYAARVVAGALAGARFVPSIWGDLGPTGTVAVAAFAVALIGGAAFVIADSDRSLVAYLLYASIAYLVVAIVVRPSYFRFGPIGEIILDRQTQLWDGRYMAAPGVALILMVVLVGDRLSRDRLAGLDARWLARLAQATLGALILVPSAANFSVDVHHDSSSHWSSQVSEQRASCQARHDKGTVTIIYGPPTDDPAWKLLLSCHQAFG